MINQMEKNKSFPASVSADDFDDEESKMEKFYELIRRFNEARAYHQRNQVGGQETKLRRINHNSSCDNQKEDVKSENGATLIPAFKWEDFRHVYRHHHHEDEEQVVVSDKSGINLLQHASNSTKSDNNIVDKYSNKRKINEIEVDDDNGDYDEITFADQNSCPQYETGLDLNLAL